MDFSNGLSPGFAKPLAQLLRLVRSGLQFCKERLKIWLAQFEMAENKIQIYKIPP